MHLQRGIKYIFELNLHRWAGVELEGDDAFLGSIGSFIGDLDGGLAVNELLDVVAFDEDAIFVPIVLLDSGLDLLTFAGFTGDFDLGFTRFRTLGDGDFLAALS